MNKSEVTVITSQKIDVVPSQIENYVFTNIARATLKATRKFFDDPHIQKEYEIWKKKRQKGG